MGRATPIAAMVKTAMVTKTTVTKTAKTMVTKTMVTKATVTRTTVTKMATTRTHPNVSRQPKERKRSGTRPNVKRSATTMQTRSTSATRTAENIAKVIAHATPIAAMVTRA